MYVKSRRGGRRRVLNTLTSSMNGTKMDQESFISILPILSQTGTRELNPGFNLTTSTSAPSGTVDDQLLSLYYRYFHSAHPCAVPRFAIQRYAVSDRRAIQPLYAVMKYIGSLHNALIPSSQLKDHVEAELAVARSTDHVVSPFAVQAVLLYSIAVYWCDETEKGLDLLEEAIQMALGLGMNRSNFATEHGRNDPILEESWRRAWWQIYITDAHIAGSTHSYPFRTDGILMDVHLPCEEEEYESGVGGLPSGMLCC